MIKNYYGYSHIHGILEMVCQAFQCSGTAESSDTKQCKTIKMKKHPISHTRTHMNTVYIEGGQKSQVNLCAGRTCQHQVRKQKTCGFNVM